MIPVNAIGTAAAAQQQLNTRKDNVAFERVVSTVMENEAEVMKKRAERTKVVLAAKEAQAKERHEERAPRASEDQGEDQKRGGLTDIYA